MEQIKRRESETIIKTIHRFSITTFIFSAISSSVYFLFDLLYPAVLVFLIGCLFLVVAYLNKMGNHIVARIIAIVTSNLGVLFFAPYIGFEAGIYLYIFTAPQLIFLLFKRSQKKLIYFCMSLNFITCFAIYFINRYSLIESIDLESDKIQMLYGVNFVFSLVFSFILVAIFAKNNDLYIDMLVDANQSLENQQEILMIEIAEKDNMNIELEKSVKEKEVLLSEVHHRVKNNLAFISSLLELENMFTKEKSVADVLKDSKNRIKSIALLHEKLYQHQNFDKIDIKNYIKELIDYIELAYSNSGKEVQIVSQIDPVFLEMDFAMPFSLLVNELITNSYKHAFSERNDGIINLRLVNANGRLSFDYSDNGVGYDPEDSVNSDSIGMNLISTFIEQMEGTWVDHSQIGRGCKMNVEINIELE